MLWCARVSLSPSPTRSITTSLSLQAQQPCHPWAHRQQARVSLGHTGETGARSYISSPSLPSSSILGPSLVGQFLGHNTIQRKTITLRGILIKKPAWRRPQMFLLVLPSALGLALACPHCSPGAAPPPLTVAHSQGSFQAPACCSHGWHKAIQPTRERKPEEKCGKCGRRSPMYRCQLVFP